IVVTPRAGVVIVEAALARAIDASDDDPHVDIGRIARVGIAMMLGRPLGDIGDPKAYAHLLVEVVDVATLRAGEQFAADLKSWLERAVGLSDSFSGFQSAGAALARVKDASCTASRAALVAFLRDLAL